MMGGNSEGRFAAFLEAARPDGGRAQWLVFPPALASQGVSDPGLEGRARCIKRQLRGPSHRAKWATIEKPDQAELARKVGLELMQYASTGWEVRTPIVIELDHDDYLKAWAPGKADTPYKALRHVDKWATKRGHPL